MIINGGCIVANVIAYGGKGKEASLTSLLVFTQPGQMMPLIIIIQFSITSP